MSIYSSNCSIQVIIFCQRAVEFGSTVTLIATLLKLSYHQQFINLKLFTIELSFKLNNKKNLVNGIWIFIICMIYQKVAQSQI